MKSTEEVHKELDLIQAVITRMSNNSFEVKKWLIGILTAIVAFKHEELLGGNSQLIWLLLVPILCFWYLDAFFLSTEKLYREMYHWAVEYRSKTDLYLYDLKTTIREVDENTVKLKKEDQAIQNVMLSKTIWPFYIVPIVFIIMYFILSYFKTEIPVCCCKCC